jgi:hypothetical protein
MNWFEWGCVGDDGDVRYGSWTGRAKRDVVSGKRVMQFCGEERHAEWS